MIEVPPELLSFLRSEEMRGQDTKLDDERAVALRFYNGLPYGDEVEGRSQVVTRDVAEVNDFMLVGILGTIMAGGKAVEFETESEIVPETGPDGQQATNPETAEPITRKVDYGAEATAAVQYQFFRKQKGYRILHDALKAGFLEKTGIVKTRAQRQKPLRQTYEVPNDAIVVDERGHTFNDLPVIEAEPIDAGWEPGQVSLMWRVTVEAEQPPKICDTVVPNEYFLLAPDATDLDTAAYVGDKSPVTISDVLEMGFEGVSRDDLETIWGSLPPDSVVETARDANRSQNRQNVGNRAGAIRSVWLIEEYPLWDFDGDGIAERLCVHRIGDKVLSVVPFDDQPYSVWSPFPATCRVVGQSMADKTMDIQRVRSVLLRQALDSLYISNAPRALVSVESMTEDTIDDLLTVRPGALIRYRGAVPPSSFVQADTSPQAFQAMEMMSAERESRTGVTRQSQGLNPETTNKTFGGMAMLQSNADQIELYVTRNFAEFIVAPIFQRRYRLMRQLIPPFRMKIDGKYTTVDPSKWPDEPDIQINVGIGTGSKDQRISYKSELLGVQREIRASGMRIVGEQQVYNLVRSLVEDTGIGVADDYVMDPASLPPEQPQPNPEVIKAQAQAEQAQSKLQLDAQKSAAELQQSGAENAAKIELMRAEAEAKLQLEREKAAQEAELAIRQQNFEMQMAERQQAFQEQQAEKQLEMNRRLAEAKSAAGTDVSISKNRPGGDLDK